MRGGSKYPADRIGHVKHPKEVPGFENRKNPYDTEHAGAQKRNNHGDYGVAHAAKYAHQHFHDSAGEIQRKIDLKPCNRIVYNLGVGRI